MLRRLISGLLKYKVSFLVILILVGGVFYWNSTRGFDDTVMAGIPEYVGVDTTSVLLDEDINNKLEPSYYEYYRTWNEQGAVDTEGFHLTIPSLQYSAISAEGTSTQSGLEGEFGNVLALENENSWVEYSISVPADGYYQMGMSYYTLPGKRSSVIRNIQVDGAYPFFQAKKMEFQRMWKEADEPWRDNQGNEFNPRRTEVAGWQSKAFIDSEAKVAEAFRFYLTKGTHTIRMNAIREPAAIGQFEVFSPEQLPTYEQVRKEYEAKGYKPVQGKLIKIQGETASLRSDATLKRVEDREPSTEPFDKDAIVLNSFGGIGWRNGGQWAEWSMDVPESGLYELGARYGQWYLNGIPVERRIEIDGKVPFQELNAAAFDYKPEWQIKKLGDEEPYLIYLEQGKHTLRMEVQLGSLGEVMEAVVGSTRKMSLLSREVIRVTGTNPDPNGDWKLEKNIPNLVPRLHLMARELDDAIHKLYEFGVKKGSSEVSTIYEARDRLLDMAADTSSIPGRLEQFTDLQSQLGVWVSGLSRQSLVLDYLIVKSPDQSWPIAASPWYVRTGTSLYDLGSSFTKNYGGVGNVYDNDETLEVWVSRGRDWVEIIKQMIDEEFTPTTGISVNVNVIPVSASNMMSAQMQKLLLASTAGLAPDVALGVEGEIPIDFAVRDGLVNLNQFSDYEEVASRFRPGALIPYKYDGGDYALPENQNFSMLFYRKDIMSQLGISEEEIPNTWEEVLELIPLLQQNGMDFYYPHSPNDTSSAINEFAPFLFQNGGDFYKDGGEKSNLDSPESLNAVKMWTGLYTNYKIQKQADFYNRFRSGEMPIGVANYATYMLLSTAAPELTGWWAMKPMPGIKQDDNSINRTTGGLAQTGVIFKASKKQEQAWEFMKWWTSADSQERFGSELEALLGAEARWNTANVEALKRLPWQQADIDAILEQWEWFEEREVVLGGYYTTRYISNIWNEIVLNGVLPRESLENAVKEINKELRKKREEFGLDNVPSDTKDQQEGGEP